MSPAKPTATTALDPNHQETAESMWALVVEAATWKEQRGFRKTRVPRPKLDESADPRDAQQVIVQVLLAGVCGTDRGIYERSSLGETILRSLAAEKQEARVVGHELVGRIVQAGSAVQGEFGYGVGDIVSAESHVYCGRCYQCRLGQTHICSDDRILGVSRDGCFAEWIKLPARVLWPTDTSKIALEVAAIQEPFGNAVHACTRVDFRGKTVGIFGCGTIGLFATMIAKSLGAARVFGVDPDGERRDLARQAGADLVFAANASSTSDPDGDPDLVEAVRAQTAGVGLDVVLEMSGFNSSLNNAIGAVRRGGEVVLFGLHSGDYVIQRYESVILKGLTLSSVIGREIFRTWTFTKRLLEDRADGIQEKILELILHHGDGTILDIGDFEAARFEALLKRYPKILLRFASL